MAEHNRALDADPCQQAAQQRGLCAWSPPTAPRARAMAVSGTIGDDDSIARGGELIEAAQPQLLHHAAVAVQHDKRRAVAAVEIVDAYVIHLDNAAEWGAIALGAPGALVNECGRGKRRRRAEGQGSRLHEAHVKEVSCPSLSQAWGLHYSWLQFLPSIPLGGII